MIERSVRRYVSFLLATTFIIGTAPHIGEAMANDGAPPFVASTPRYSFDIPAMSVQRALNEIGRITGTSISLDNTGFAQLGSLTSRPVRGDLTAEEALKIVLSRTGATYQMTGGGTAQIVPPAPNAARDANAQATELPPITISSAKPKARRATQPVAPAVPPPAPPPAVNAGGDIGYHANSTSTATKTNTPLRDIPQSITVVTKQQIQDIGAQSLEAVSHYIPGVNWHQGEGNRDQIVIRGQSSTADFFVNGMRDDAQVYRDIYNTERLEYLKGPNAMIFGRGGGGGVLNRVLKEADGVPINEWKTQTGSYSNARVSGDVGGKITDNVYGRINGVFEDTDSYRDYFHMQRGGVNPTLTWLATPLTKVKLSYEYFRDVRTADRGIPSQNGFPYFPASPGAFFGNPDLSQTWLTQNIATAVVEHDFNNGLSVKNQTRFAAYAHVYQNVYPGTAVNAADLYRQSAYKNNNDRQNLMNQTDWTYKFYTDVVKHTVVFGTEFGDREVRQRAFQRHLQRGCSIALHSCIESDDVPVRHRFSRTGERRAQQDRSRSGAVYIQDQIEVTRWLQFIGGVRYDRFDLDYVT